MKIIKKFTAIQVVPEKVNSVLKAEFEFGHEHGPHYDLEEPITEHDNEYDATMYAYSMNKYATWIIVPTISFEIEN